MTCLEDADFALALRLQEEENQRAGVSVIAVKQPVDVAEFAGSQKRPNVSRSDASPARPLPPPGTSLVDEAYELIDPTPDIYQLFRDFDRHFFWGKLGGVELKWSPRMTRCAGVCSYQPASGLCSVRLSRPLLTLRPRSDLVETLLHEMIHALLFVTRNIDNHEEHGPEFHRHMHRINKIAGTNITVYHTFHEEVKHMLTHWWRCTGPCRSRPPYFGFVKRSMNRAPGKSDFWWPNHQTTCGGTFEKIKEPDGYGKKKGNKDIGSDNTLRDIRNFVVKGKAVPVTEKPPKRPNGSTTPAGGASAVGGRPGRGMGRGRGSGRGRGGRPTPGDARPTTGRPGKRPTTSTSGDGASAQKRPSVNPAAATGVRPNIGTVSNDGNQRVNNIANNVHGFQKGSGRGRGGGGATAMAGGSRTVTVPVRGRGRGRGAGGSTEERTTGGDERTGGGGLSAEPGFVGRGHVLGGGSGVPWYKRDLPPPGLLQFTVPSASTSAAGTSRESASTSRTPNGSTSTSRNPTGIFSSPEHQKPTAATKSTEDWEIMEDDSSLVSCPVCGENVNLQVINEHVDLCLATECERSEKSTGAGGGTKSCDSPGPSSDSVWQDDEDELMMSQAADELETSLEVTGWEESTEDDQLLADAADELETSLAADSARGDRPDIYSANADDTSATARSPASDASTVYDDILGGGAGAARSRSPSDASTVYDEIINEPIVISSSDDDDEGEEDIATQRANLSDVIKDFIKVEESDDDMFED